MCSAASLHIEYPMLFKVESRSTGRSTHCGVLEFSADEGMVYMPYWVRKILAQLAIAITIPAWRKALCRSKAGTELEGSLHFFTD